ncbi:HAD family hydrolase [Prevotella denticola]
MIKETDDALFSSRSHLFSSGNIKEKEPVSFLFDFGGTLDTAGCHWGKMLWHAFERKCVPITESQFREAYVYAERTLDRQNIIQPDFTFRQMLAEKLRIETGFLIDKGWLYDDKRMEMKLRDALVKDLYNSVKANITAARKVLERLKMKHRIGLVTNFYGNMSIVLDEFGLSSLFETVTESAVVGVRKPDPQIFRLAVAALRERPENVVVVGDSYAKDILPAHETGCKTVWLKGEGWTEDDPAICVADRIIKGLDEL